MSIEISRSSPNRIQYLYNIGPIYETAFIIATSIRYAMLSDGQGSQQAMADFNPRGTYFDQQTFCTSLEMLIHKKFI